MTDSAHLLHIAWNIEYIEWRRFCSKKNFSRRLNRTWVYIMITYYYIVRWRWRRSLSARPSNPHLCHCQLDRKDSVQFQRRRRLATTNHRVIFFSFSVLLYLFFPWPLRRDFVRPFRSKAAAACARPAYVPLGGRQNVRLKRKEIKVNMIFLLPVWTAKVRRENKLHERKNRAMINNKIAWRCRVG